MADILIRNVPAETLEALEGLMGNRKRETFVRDLLVRTGDHALASAGKRLPCREDFNAPVLGQSETDAVDADLGVLFRKRLITDPTRKGRLLPLGLWENSASLLVALSEIQDRWPTFHRTRASAVLAEKFRQAVESGRPAPAPFFACVAEDNGILPDPGLRAADLSDLTERQISLFLFIATSFVRMMATVSEHLAPQPASPERGGENSPVDKLIRLGGDVIEALVQASRNFEAGDVIWGCMIFPEEIEPGLHPSELSLTFTAADGHQEFVTVDRSSLVASGLPVGGEVGGRADGSVLVEFPREADSGTHRIYLPPMKVIRVQSASGKTEANLLSARVRLLADALVEAANTFRPSLPKQAARAGYIGGLLGLIDQVGVGGRQGVQVEILKTAAAA